MNDSQEANITSQKIAGTSDGAATCKRGCGVDYNKHMNVFTEQQNTQFDILSLASAPTTALH